MTAASFLRGKGYKIPAICNLFKEILLRKIE